ncbi:MAG: hypothetical protein LQ338_007331 [Usnochroma carphineum]|nr:MAG: hypothetical protein LQ338_007331 [Usnochroma carphineum]
MASELDFNIDQFLDPSLWTQQEVEELDQFFKPSAPVEERPAQPSPAPVSGNVVPDPQAIQDGNNNIDTLIAPLLTVHDDFSYPPVQEPYPLDDTLDFADIGNGNNMPSYPLATPIQEPYQLDGNIDFTNFGNDNDIIDTSIAPSLAMNDNFFYTPMPSYPLAAPLQQPYQLDETLDFTNFNFCNDNNNIDTPIPPYVPTNHDFSFMPLPVDFPAMPIEQTYQLEDLSVFNTIPDFTSTQPAPLPLPSTSAPPAQTTEFTYPPPTTQRRPLSQTLSGPAPASTTTTSKSRKRAAPTAAADGDDNHASEAEYKTPARQRKRRGGRVKGYNNRREATKSELERLRELLGPLKPNGNQ